MLPKTPNPRPPSRVPSRKTKPPAQPEVDNSGPGVPWGGDPGQRGVPKPPGGSKRYGAAVARRAGTYIARNARTRQG